jgi:hypothetical protein
MDALKVGLDMRSADIPWLKFAESELPGSMDKFQIQSGEARSMSSSETLG